MGKILMSIYTIAAIAAIVLFGAGCALAYFRIVPPITGFGLFALGCLLGVGVTAGGIVAMLRGNTGLVVAVWFLGAVPAGFLAYGIIEGRNYPVINDISTEVNHPPEFAHAKELPENKEWDMGFPAENAEVIQEHYPQIKTLPLQGTIDDIYGRADQLASGQPGWTIIGNKQGEKRRTIEGYCETGVFHFRDYFIIEIREIDGGAVVVDMRSKSKDGKGDFGVNSKRIHDFLEKLKA